MAHGAPFCVRSDHLHLAHLSQLLPGGQDAASVDSIIVGEEDERARHAVHDDVARIHRTDEADWDAGCAEPKAARSTRRPPRAKDASSFRWIPAWDGRLYLGLVERRAAGGATMDDPIL